VTAAVRDMAAWKAAGTLSPDVQQHSAYARAPMASAAAWPCERAVSTARPSGRDRAVTRLLVRHEGVTLVHAQVEVCANDKQNHLMPLDALAKEIVQLVPPLRSSSASLEAKIMAVKYLCHQRLQSGSACKIENKKHILHGFVGKRSNRIKRRVACGD
jgi:hypothetical protein